MFHRNLRRHFDLLEARKLLAATLDGGVLNVLGTGGNDTILIFPAGDGSQVVATINGAAQQFLRSQITSFFIRGAGGNDNIEYAAIAGETRPITCYGDSGDDVI